MERLLPVLPQVIEAGVKRVVIGMEDPNPLVKGKGIESLRRAGLDVEVGILEKECRRLNEAFCKYILKKEPFVILKVAATLDGKIATRNGDSKWISGEASRRFVHRLRDQVDGVLVGIGTVLKDDPHAYRPDQGGKRSLSYCFGQSIEDSGRGQGDRNLSFENNHCYNRVGP